MQACAASSPTPTHLTLKGSQGQSSLSATLTLPLTQSVSKVCCKAGNCLMTDKIAAKLYSFAAILSIYGIDQCCSWHISVIKEPATVPDVRSAYSLPLIHVLFMITNNEPLKHVTPFNAANPLQICTLNPQSQCVVRPIVRDRPKQLYGTDRIDEPAHNEK